MSGERVCFRCKVCKPLAEYYRSNARYYQRECKSCTKQRRAKWWRSAVGKRSSASTKLKARFGITLEQYEALLAAQGGKCSVCEARVSVMGHRLGIDHCHKTGTMRGILCKTCNLGVGNFQDSPELLRKAAAYLEKPPGQATPLTFSAVLKLPSPSMPSNTGRISPISKRGGAGISHNGESHASKGTQI